MSWKAKAPQVRVADTLIHRTSTNATRRELLGTSTRFGLGLDVMLPKNMTETELISTLIHWRKMDCDFATPRVERYVTELSLESTEPLRIDPDTMHRVACCVCTGMRIEAPAHPVRKMICTYPLTSESGKLHQVMTRSSTCATRDRRICRICSVIIQNCVNPTVPLGKLLPCLKRFLVQMNNCSRQQ